MSFVEIKHYTKTIKGVHVLDDVSLALEKGKIYGFWGRNGSGKTMLFRAVCGLIKPTSGSIVIDGKTIHRDISFPPSVGALIETPGFWPAYTGFENLKTLAGIKKMIGDSEIRAAIQRVGLDPGNRNTYKKYSLGMKQRLGIAQAIMEKPDLIVLDEPTNALDEDGVQLIRSILLEEKQRGATILIASHNSDDIDLLADQKYSMSSGRLSPFEREVHATHEKR